MFLYSSWQKLSTETKAKIAAKFGISKSLPTHVFDNRVIQDGYPINDIESKLTLDSVQKFLGSNETDMAKLWGWLVDKVEGRVPTEEIAAVVNEPVTFSAGTVEPIPEPEPIVIHPKKHTKKKK